jgi:hypothetical protein
MLTEIEATQKEKKEYQRGSWKKIKENNQETKWERDKATRKEGITDRKEEKN